MLRRRPDLLALAAFLGATLVALLFLGRESLPQNDDWDFWLRAPSYDPGELLHEWRGHPVAVTRLVWNLTTDVTGGETFVAHRLLFYAMHLAVLALFYVLVAPRIGRALGLIALVPLALAGLTWLSFASPLSGIVHAGGVLGLLGALVALQRGTRRADAVACGVLVVAAFTSGAGLAAIAGAAAFLLWPQPAADRRRLWVVAVPLLFLFVWFLAYRPDNGYGIELVDVALIPSYVADGLAAGIRVYTYLVPEWATALSAAFAVLLVVWALRPGGFDRTLVAVLVAGAAFWGLIAFVRGLDIRANDARYLYPAAVHAMLMVALLAARAGVRSHRTMVVTLGVLVVAFALPSANQMRQSAKFDREKSLQSRAALTAVELAGPLAPNEFNPLAVTRGDAAFTVGRYREALSDGRSLAYDRDELDGLPERLRDVLDATLVPSLGITLRAIAAPDEETCRPLTAPVDAAPGTTVVVRNDGGAKAPLLISRFTTRTRPAGEVAPGGAASLAFPRDGSPKPWRVSAGAPLAVCG